MLKRTTKILQTIPLPDQLELGKCTYEMCELLSKNQIAENIALNNLSTVTNNFYNYVSNTKQGSFTMKANLLSLFGNQEYPLNGIIKKNPLLLYDNSAKIPCRVFSELAQADILLNTKQEAIKDITFTADKIEVIHRSTNRYKDFFIKFSHPLFGESLRDYDAKSNLLLQDDWFKGHVKTLFIKDKQAITFPDSSFELDEGIHYYYSNTINRLLSQSFQNDCMQKMKPLEYKAYLDVKEKLYSLYKTEKIINIENVALFDMLLLSAQQIPTFPKAITFVSIVKLPQTVLSADEILFLEKMGQYTHPGIFNNVRTLQQYTWKAITVYRKIRDNNIYKKIKPLAQKCEWIQSELDNISSDIYLS